MIYLCENYDLEEKLLPNDPKLKGQVIQWVNILFIHKKFFIQKKIDELINYLLYKILGYVRSGMSWTYTRTIWILC